MYISPDGNFVFGGSPQGWDMFVGVRTGIGTPSFSGLYYQAGLDQNASTLISDGYAELDSYYGSLSAGGGNIANTQRLFSPFQSNVFDYTYTDTYSTPSSSGTYSTSSMNCCQGAGRSAYRVRDWSVPRHQCRDSALSFKRQRTLSESHGHRKRSQLRAFHGGRGAGRAADALRNRSGGFAGGCAGYSFSDHARQCSGDNQRRGRADLLCVADPWGTRPSFRMSSAQVSHKCR